MAIRRDTAISAYGFASKNRGNASINHA